MSKARILSIVFAACLLTLSGGYAYQQPTGAPQRAMLDKYCVTCHNERLKTAGLMLDKMDLNQVPEHAETWEKVILKLRGGMMPPLGAPRPEAASVTAMVGYLETSI